MPTEYRKDNDYTLRATDVLKRVSSGYPESAGLRGLAIEHTLTRIFNFSAAQVITIESQTLNGESNSAMGFGASSQMAIQNFSDIQSDSEIRLMHKKLVELGGRPPALDVLLGKTP